MSKVKIYGPAPEPIDEKELALAQMLQNAGARELKWTSWALYRDGGDRLCDPENAVSCCAIGAAYLEADSKSAVEKMYGVTTGNDYKGGFWDTSSPYEDVGYAFRKAMTSE